MARYSMGQQIKREWTLYNEMRLELPSLSMNESMARAAVAAFCAQADPSAVELADVKCAMSEAVTNCIVHAYRGTVGKVQIRVRIYNERCISVEVRDRGCGIEDVRQAREPLYTTDREGERSGMGFTVMESFCDGIRVVSSVGKGTSVTLVKRLEVRPSLT